MHKFRASTFISNSIDAGRKRWNKAMIAVALIMLLWGIWNLPFLPLPNDFNNFPEPVFSTALTNLSPYFSDNVSVNVALRAYGPEVAVGIPMDLLIYFEIEPLKSATSITAIPENALAYNSSSQRLIYKYASVLITLQNGYWEGDVWVEYFVAGIYGVTFLFYYGGAIVARIHSGPFYTIGSEDLIAAKYNGALTTSLSLFVLMFTALEVRSRPTNGKRKKA